MRAYRNSQWGVGGGAVRIDFIIHPQTNVLVGYESIQKLSMEGDGIVEIDFIIPRQMD